MTAGSVYQKKYRNAQKDNKEYRTIQSMYQHFWRLANADRYKEIRRASEQRSTTWKNARGKFTS